MSKAKECKLQTFVGTHNGKLAETLLKQELWWKIDDVTNIIGADTRFKYYLLKFKSLMDREKFKKMYCHGHRQLGVRTFGVRCSPWRDVPKIFMNLDGIYDTEKVVENVADGRREGRKPSLLDKTFITGEEPEMKVDMIKLNGGTLVSREKTWSGFYSVKITTPKPMSDEDLRKLASYVATLKSCTWGCAE